ASFQNQAQPATRKNSMLLRESQRRDQEWLTQPREYYAADTERVGFFGRVSGFARSDAGWSIAMIVLTSTWIFGIRARELCSEIFKRFLARASPGFGRHRWIGPNGDQYRGLPTGPESTGFRHGIEY